MNVLLKVHSPPDAAKIAHSVIAYDRATEELDLELPIPLFLDTLALKIARVPPRTSTAPSRTRWKRELLIPSGSCSALT